MKMLDMTLHEIICALEHCMKTDDEHQCRGCPAENGVFCTLIKDTPPEPIPVNLLRLVIDELKCAEHLSEKALERKSSTIYCPHCGREIK